jgi:peptidoglycan/LPS O-acetylase OafA/YrhL
LVVVVLVVHAIDRTDPSTDGATSKSVVNVLTYTWNTYLVDHTLEARPDLGHLWYLSVQQQVYLVLPLAVLLLAPHRRAFIGVLVAAAAAVVVNRYAVLEDDGYWVASLLTTTRADGLLLGAALAVALPSLRRLRRETWMIPASLVAMAALVAASPELAQDQYLREWGLAVTLVSVVLVGALVVDDSRSWSRRVLEAPVLQWLGNASLAIYVWHYPLFWFMTRHTPDWPTGARVVATVVALASIVVVAQRFIEEPTRRWLQTSAWFRAPSRPAGPRAEEPAVPPPRTP